MILETDQKTVGLFGSFIRWIPVAYRNLEAINGSGIQHMNPDQCNHFCVNKPFFSQGTKEVFTGWFNVCPST